MLLVASACAAIRPASILEEYNPDATATAVRLAVEQFHDGLRTRNIEKILTTFIADTSFRAYDGDEGWLTFDNIRLQDAAAFCNCRSIAANRAATSCAVAGRSYGFLASSCDTNALSAAGTAGFSFATEAGSSAAIDMSRPIVSGP